MCQEEGEYPPRQDNLTKDQVAEIYIRLSGKEAKLSHVSTGMMKTMAPIMRPFQPVISRLMTAGVWGDTTDQTFDCTAMLREFPMQLTHVEDFIREQVSKK